MKEKRPFKGQCRPRVCTFEIPASVEAAYRAGDPEPLAEQLVEHMRQLGKQIASDYDAQMTKGEQDVPSDERIRSRLIQ